MIEAFRNAFKVPELRKKILFTAAIIAVYRFGCHVTVPGVDANKIQQLFKGFAQAGGNVMGILDIFAGGALSKFAVFALGIMPYITASIIMELLTVVIPKIEQWAKEGESGRKKMTQWTRYLTLVLATIESIGLTAMVQSQLSQVTKTPVVFSLQTKFLIVITMVAGTVLVMWLSELITQKGIGNGMSIMITASVVSRFPGALWETIRLSYYKLFALVPILLIAIGAIVVIESAQRRVPVQYAKRVVGRKMYGGQSTYIPIKINSAGVIPIIFANALLVFPATLASFFPNNKYLKIVGDVMGSGSFGYYALLALFIIFFTYFYTAIVFNPIDISDNIKKYGGFIPGVRPGGPTASYLDQIISRVTLPGAIFLTMVAIVPTVIGTYANIPFFSAGNLGGISLLIVVGVSLETVSQLEAQLVMRHYEGFLK